MAKNAPQLIVFNASDEAGSASQLGDSHHRVGDRSTGGLQPRATGCVQGFCLLFINERHAAFLQAVLRQKRVVGLNKHINDGIADADDIKTASFGESDVGGHDQSACRSEVWRSAVKRLGGHALDHGLDLPPQSFGLGSPQGTRWRSGPP